MFETRVTGERSPLLPTSTTTRHTLHRVPSATCDGDDHGFDDDLSTSVHGTERFIARRHRRSKHFCHWLILLLRMFSLVTLTFFFIDSFQIPSVFFWSAATHPRTTPPSIKVSADHDQGAPFAPPSVQKLWAILSPYRVLEEYQHPPKDCELTQVNILQRHGARHPTPRQAVHIQQALHRLQAAESYTDDRLQFLANYTYGLNVIDLVPFGELQSFEAGRKVYSRYKSLVNTQDVPFIRASGNRRVVQSAFKWAEGFGADYSDIFRLPPTVIIPEGHNVNNTLTNENCPNAPSSKVQVQEWQSIYAKPVADRLNSGARGLPENLTSEDAHSLITLCALETLAREKYSPFCRLFTEKEFQGFEYALDLDKFYLSGHGSRLGPVQGVGYINELLARLTDRPVQDRTGTNHTLDSNPETFPLGRGVYADFTHDDPLVSVISAMGLFDSGGNGPSIDGAIMDPRKPKKGRAWVMSKIVPFSARLVVERMECSLPLPRESNGMDIDVYADGGEKLRGERQRRRKSSEGEESSVYVRVLVNDAVQELDFCGGSDEDGLCLLREFVKSQEYARENGKGDWEKCFE